MNTIKIWNNKPSDKQLDEICNVLEAGEIIIIPTDSIYAIACNALDRKAIDKICRLKGINPEKTNLSILCSSISMASEYARIDNKYYQMLKANTPGPFTFLFKAASSLPKTFKDRKIVGIRIPDNSFCRELIERLGTPLLSTSVQFNEDDYAVNPELIAENYENKVDLMVEGEQGGTTPSAVIDCTGSEPIVIRDGERELI